MRFGQRILWMGFDRLLEQQFDSMRASKDFGSDTYSVRWEAHYFIRDNEIHYEVAASADKDFIVIEGATHGITPCAPMRAISRAVFEYREELF